MLDELQIPSKDFRKLQAVPLDKLMPAYFAASRKHRFNHATTGFAPVVDGKVLPQHPFHPTASAVMPEVPVIVGTNRTEMHAAAGRRRGRFRSRRGGFAGARSRNVRRPGAGAGRGLSQVGAGGDAIGVVLPDGERSGYCAPIMKIAERRAALGKAPVYFYYFAWETPVQGGR